MRGSITLAVLLVLSTARSQAAEPDAAAIAFFEKQVRPLLVEHCHSCHSAKAKKARGGLELDSREAILKGGDTGPAVEPGKPEKSLLMSAVNATKTELQMPPKGKLRAPQIAALETWIRDGAVYPAGAKAATTTAFDPSSPEAKQFWSFRPLKPQPAPVVQNAKWSQRPIDTFLLAAMEQRKLTPSAPADRRVLIRRAAFDLTGLPPTPEEVDAFVRDTQPDAFARLVNRLLESPHYGERWARYWLDLARYCDVPETWMTPRGQAWPYRDWVVKALNNDLPYDQFVMRQLAADLMPGVDPKERAALGFMGVSPDYWKELQLDVEVIKSIVADEWEERIDTVSGTFLGLTTACARCHDHKFDPISTKDYYSLAGVIAGMRQVDLPLLPNAEAAAVKKAEEEIQKLEAQIKALKGAKPAPADAKVKLEELTARVKRLEETPGYKAVSVRGIADAHVSVVSKGPNQTRLEYEDGKGHDIAMHMRGNPARPGPVVPRQFLTVLSRDGAKPFTQGSGRLELAKAIVTDGAPLAARVIVNRVWKHHFGRGLVDTLSDFGRQGERPSHPELLDDLASRFVAEGWSLKWLHRELMLSSAYQQASAPDATKQAIDPDNRWLWRMNRRRLEVESWRDSMLAVNGTLRRELGGPPQELTDANNRRRTVYGLVRRTDLTDLLRLHDFPDPLAHSATRIPTTTPLQQLFTLNGPLLRQEATTLAKRLEAEVPASGADRVRRAYELLFNRVPTDKEIKLAVAFLGEKPNADAWSRYAHVLLGSNEFLFID
ncbi:MAG: PSD1 and planctomycete cytochrome C domain-containing protein [Planctomycetes bacterium]|nr:PSD1 and planctomycete cytochrome C domain-containing protein [Planctomycetota bacterium]